ncbi:unnamed protein product [Vicia faba]|uniref:Pectinesterase inhibitor domain-containing protein n=1 Tax=Vicia faba TaxID=3906 RepID=A0AAV0YES7_VICFA|nr:unnamed protein product [Vicia faba]
MFITLRLMLLLIIAIFLSLLTNTSQMVYPKGNNINNNNMLRKHAVSQGEVKNVQAYLKNLKSSGNMKGRNKVALLDCIETFGYALDELHKSLGVLRRLSKKTFSTQMGDLNTWISSALTDEDTCLDGFEGENERRIKLLQNKVQNVSYITSNALALVNKLASTGFESSIIDP